MDVEIDGESFHAQVEVRFLPAVRQWFVSIWDHSSGELLVNQIPLLVSVGKVNDLLRPFRYLRDGKGLGSLMCLHAADAAQISDPNETNLTEYQVLWGDTAP